MRNFILGTIWLLLSNVAIAEENDSPPIQVDENVYTLLAASSITYLHRMYDIENDPEKKLFYAQKIARGMFSYWYETTYLSLSKSRKVESIVIDSYRWPVDQKLKQVIEDPLDRDRLRQGRAYRTNWKFSSVEEYNVLLDEYITFLRAGRRSDIESDQGTGD